MTNLKRMSNWLAKASTRVKPSFRRSKSGKLSRVSGFTRTYKPGSRGERDLLQHAVSHGYYKDTGHGFLVFNGDGRGSLSVPESHLKTIASKIDKISVGKRKQSGNRIHTVHWSNGTRSEYGTNSKLQRKIFSMAEALHNRDVKEKRKNTPLHEKKDEVVRALGYDKISTMETWFEAFLLHHAISSKMDFSDKESQRQLSLGIVPKKATDQKEKLNTEFLNTRVMDIYHMSKNHSHLLGNFVWNYGLGFLGILFNPRGDFIRSTYNINRLVRRGYLNKNDTVRDVLQVCGINPKLLLRVKIDKSLVVRYKVKGWLAKAKKYSGSKLVVTPEARHHYKHMMSHHDEMMKHSTMQMASRIGSKAYKYHRKMATIHHEASLKHDALLPEDVFSKIIYAEKKRPNVNVKGLGFTPYKPKVKKSYPCNNYESASDVDCEDTNAPEKGVEEKQPKSSVTNKAKKWLKAHKKRMKKDDGGTYHSVVVGN